MRRRFAIMTVPPLSSGTNKLISQNNLVLNKLNPSHETNNLLVKLLSNYQFLFQHCSTMVRTSATKIILGLIFVLFDCERIEGTYFDFRFARIHYQLSYQRDRGLRVHTWACWLGIIWMWPGGFPRQFRSKSTHGKINKIKNKTNYLTTCDYI